MASTDLAATDLATAIAAGTLSAEEATRDALDAIARQDGTIHAFVTVDAEGALAAARACDAARAAGTPQGPLAGVPIAIKDLVDVKGLPTTRGLMRDRETVAAEDDPVVARLRAAGAIILGKTNTPECGFGALCRNAVAGNTVSPAAPTRSSGGSSGGSAAAVAARMVPLAHGTDFGGSVRTPASFCDIVGYRPGPGRIPSTGKPLGWNALAVHGVLARTVRDAALMAHVMSGGDARDPVSLFAPPLAPLSPDAAGGERIAASVDLGGITPVARDVRDAFAAALARLPADLIVSEDAPDLAGAAESFATLRAAIIHHELSPLLAAEGEALSPTVRWNIAEGRALAAETYLAADAHRTALYRRCLAFFEKHDALLTVSASVAPFLLDQEDVTEIDGIAMASPIAYLTITSAISLVGLPAISIPAGRTPEGLPVGVQLIGPPASEPRLLSLAQRLESALKIG